MTALIQESFDRLDYSTALALSKQHFPAVQVQQPDRSRNGSGANDDSAITIGAVVGVVLLLILLSVVGVASFVFSRKFK